MLSFCKQAIGVDVPNVLVRDVAPETLAALKTRARQHRRSLQQELAALLEEAAQQGAQPSPDEIAAAIRIRLARPGRVFTDSTGLIRDDRAR
jgi:plasmid stability protein